MCSKICTSAAFPICLDAWSVCAEVCVSVSTYGGVCAYRGSRLAKICFASAVFPEHSPGKYGAPLPCYILMAAEAHDAFYDAK